MKGETNLSILIKNMHPILNKGQYVFCTILDVNSIDFKQIIHVFKEKEGYTLVIEKEYAHKKGYEYTSTFAWITLLVHSSLDAVGLTAAFATALAENKISCNVVAGFYHDHIFVPYDLGQQAVNVLQKLSMECHKTIK